MDRNAILILVVAALLMVFWGDLVDKIVPPSPRRSIPLDVNGTGAGNNATVNTNQAPVIGPVEGNQTQLEGNGTRPENNGTVIPEANATATAPLPVLKPQKPETTQSVEAGPAEFIFTSRGGGISEVLLRDHPIDTGKPSSATNRVALNRGEVLPLFALWGTNQTLTLTGREDYTLAPIGEGNTTKGWRATLEAGNGIKIIKEFMPTDGFLMTNVVVKIQNLSTNQIMVPSLHVALGSSTPAGMGKLSDAMYHGVFWFDGNEDTHYEQGDFANRTLGCFPGTEQERFTAGNKNVRWSAVHNQFYTIIAMVPEGGLVPDTVTARHIDFGPDASTQLKAQNRYMASVNYRNDAAMLGPNQEWSATFDLYAGPKKYRDLEALSIARGNNQVDRVMDLGGFFGFFSKVLLLSMNSLYGWGCSYAIAIIIITIVIKAIFWPLTAASTRSMKRMGKMQPQMKEIQTKYKDDPQKMNQKMMAFMKEHKVNPLAGCLPMIIQIPVFFGFFFMIRTAVELRGEEFLWVMDLSRPDTVYVIPGITFIPFFSTPAGLPVNPMPILMGVTMIIQTRITPTSPSADEMQAKMMKYMPLIFIPILYNFSSGLTLYWTVQNILSIAQTKMTKADPDEDKPASTAKPVDQPKERKPRKKRH